MKTTTFWSIIIILALVVAVTFMHSASEKKDSILPKLSSEGVNAGAASREKVSVPSTGASAAISSPVVSGQRGAIPKAPVSPNTAAPMNPESVQQQDQSAAPVILNAPMSDQQILEGIESQNQANRSLQKMLDKRDREATQVRRAVAAEQLTQQKEQQKMPSDFSREQPPEDIVIKLKTHQLTAH